MTPKEWNLMYAIIEQASQAAYLKGHAEGVAGKPARSTAYTLSKENKLVLKTNIEKQLKTR